MNLDSNVQKILFAIMRRWKLVVLFALIGALAGYFYTANFTKQTFTSKVEFLAYATDGNDDVAAASSNGEIVRSSNTSKMNYAMRMLDTYIEIMQTNKFAETLSEDMNETYNANYDADTVLGKLEITSVESTAMFKISVTTNDAELSYRIAKQLETTVPRMMKEKNNGLVRSSVEDRAMRSTSAESKNYPKKMMLAALVGAVLAIAYIVLRTLLDVRIKSGEELTEKYSIPVLGSIPNFESRLYQTQSAKGVSDYVKTSE